MKVYIHPNPESDAIEVKTWQVKGEPPRVSIDYNGRNISLLFTGPRTYILEEYDLDDEGPKNLLRQLPFEFKD
jgi:hypothetical protein